MEGLAEEEGFLTLPCHLKTDEEIQISIINEGEGHELKGSHSGEEIQIISNLQVKMGNGIKQRQRSEKQINFKKMIRLIELGQREPSSLVMLSC